MSGDTVIVVGIDCATQPQNTGLALGRLTGGKLALDQVRRASKRQSADQIVLEWIRNKDCVLLALDAPLGWPAPLGTALQAHRAGAAIPVHADALFRRMTDQNIEDRLGKRPFEVGANLIARTARAALEFLDEIRKSIPVELAWSSKLPGGVYAIEVYPAATRLSLGGPRGPVTVQWLKKHANLPPAWSSKSPHEADAIVCVIAGARFLMGLAHGPSKAQTDLAHREGWIWT